MSYFVQVITTVMMALLHAKCTAALSSTNFEQYNMCTVKGPNQEVSEVCPGFGECQEVSVDFWDQEEWQDRTVGICYPHEKEEGNCITRGEKWPLQQDNAATNGILCHIYDEDVEPMKKDDPSTEKAGSSGEKTGSSAKGSRTRRNISRTSRRRRSHGNTLN